MIPAEPFNPITAPPMRAWHSFSYLAGTEARDISRITGIPWSYGRTESRGATHPLIDLSALNQWDRVRVTWALVAGYAYLESIGYDRTELEAERNLSYWEGRW